ncbi:MAG: hypothetical protein ACRDY4_13870 [Acidimicrobiia bacterium]
MSIGMVPMQQLTWVSGSFPARVLEARLHFEGIEVELRGAVDGPYGFTVGAMARIDVFVPVDQLDDARFVLLADEVDAALAAPREWGGTTRGPSAWSRAGAWAALVAAALAPVVWYLRQ